MLVLSKVRLAAQSVRSHVSSARTPSIPWTASALGKSPYFFNGLDAKPSGAWFSAKSAPTWHSDLQLDKYRYEPLPPGPSIRQLVVYPATHQLSHGGEHIAVALRACPANLKFGSWTKTAQSYEALSYVWDDPYAPKLLPGKAPRILDKDGRILCPISIDGRYHIGVTPNLYLALRALRYENKPRTLWVDALCINQSSSEEKSSQIPLMNLIYTNASKVIIWLGEEDDWTATSAKVIDRWAAIYRQHVRTGAHQPEIRADLKASGDFELGEQPAFEAIIRRAWFTRAWTFQELCLAEDASLHCGSRIIPWLTFGDACAAVIAAGQENLVFEEHENIRTLYEFRNLCRQVESTGRESVRLSVPSSHSVSQRKFQLSALLQRARLQQATDPRDKLYSLLGIANPPKIEGAYRVDYNEPTHEVFTRFTRDMIKEDGDLRILSGVQQAQSAWKLVEYAKRGSAWRALEDASKEEGQIIDIYAERRLEQNVLRQLQEERMRSLVQESESEPKSLVQASTSTSGLPSWVPQFATQDHIEYVVTDGEIGLSPSDLIRTKYPRPIARHSEEGWPHYCLNPRFSSRMDSGDITFDTGNNSHLGVWGLKIGTIRSVFDMPFTSDPSVRVFPVLQEDLSDDSEQEAPQEPEGEGRTPEFRAPFPPHPLNFNFSRSFIPVDTTSKVDEELIQKQETYRLTGEPMPLAILKTLTADMLPISSRLSTAQKTTLFPFHYDWYFWNGAADSGKKRFPSSVSSSNSLTAFLHNKRVPFLQDILDLLSFVARWLRARFSLWLRGQKSNVSWSEFDATELRNPRRLRKMYTDFLTSPANFDILDARPAARTRLGNILHGFGALSAYCAVSLFLGVTYKYWAPAAIYKALPRGVLTIGLMIFVWIMQSDIPKARRFELDMSVPAGWDRLHEKVILEQMTDSSDNIFNVESRHGIWGIACEIQDSINRASWNREFYVTDNGYIGIGPVGMKAGDEAWALIGSRVPFVLRPSAGAGQSRTSAVPEYQLLGESYVHGVMDGELWGDKMVWKRSRKGRRTASKLILI